MRLGLSAILAASFSAAVFSYPTQVLYFTTNTLQSGTSVEPGFELNHIWTSSGVGINGRIYVAVSNTLRSHVGATDPNAKGDVCVVEYNPYNNTMKSCGTVKKACSAVNNWLPNESQEKIHCYLQSTPDGKIWMATHDNDELPNHYYRGSHILYVDVLHGDTLVDYSNQHKYAYKRESALPVLNHIELPASDTSNISIQWHSIMILGINPHIPRYMWTHSIPNGYLQVWDRIADTTRTIGTADGSQREMAIGRDGSCYYNANNVAYKKTVNGVTKQIATTLPGTGGCMTYTHSYDSAYTIPRGTGEVILYDMKNDAAKVIADLPDNGTSNKAYRAVCISADGKHLFIIGDNNKLYDLTIATGQYAVVQTLSELSGQSYATSRTVVDTLGNWYINLFAGGLNSAALLKISMGKNVVKPLAVPGAQIALEKAGPLASVPGLSISPNPFRGLATLRLPGAGSLVIYDVAGRALVRTGLLSRGEFRWNAGALPAGVYMARASVEGKTLSARLVLLK